VSIAVVLFVIALVLAFIEEFNAQGRSLLGWAVVFVCLGLLWGQFG
jgi:hypothetical protein